MTSNFRDTSPLNPLCLDTDMHLSLLRGRLTHHANSSKGPRRKRRSIDERFVETLVVADRTMVDAFGSKADLQSYILTLMGVVSKNECSR